MPALSFTQLRHRPVHDSEGTEIGHLEDLFVLPLGTRPQVTKFSLRRPDREEWILPWASVAEVPETTDRPIRLRIPLADLSPVALRAEEVPLGKTVLDKKVVDTARKKVVRVNDIELAESEGGLQVTGIEGGLRGHPAASALRGIRRAAGRPAREDRSPTTSSPGRSWTRSRPSSAGPSGTRCTPSWPSSTPPTSPTSWKS